MLRLAILDTHPIQYHAHWFRHIASAPNVDLKVLYCHQASAAEQSTAGFGVDFEWDVPLLDGYEYRVLKNVAKQPSIHSFRGLDTPELAGLISKDNFDALVVNGWHYKSAWQGFLACRKNSIPILVRSDSHLRTERSVLKSAAKFPIYRAFIPMLDACLPVGTWSRDYFAHYGASPAHIFTVPHCVDSSRIEIQAESLVTRRAHIRESFGFGPEHIVWVYSGKFIPKKRPLDFVRALSLASRKNPLVTGLMVGDGPLWNECRAMSANLGTTIHFAGFLNQNEIAKAYVAADGLVLPSDGRETWGLVVNEAMVCGKPCIVSDRVGCGPDLIETGKTGWIFPMGSVDELADRMTRSSTPEELSVLGSHAKAKISAHSTAAATKQLLHAVTETTNRSLFNGRNDRVEVTT